VVWRVKFTSIFARGLLADGLGLDYFVKIVGLGVVADEMGIALAAVVVDRGCLEIVVHDNQ
jgi:hypothetical protein